jgi:hypothetical protein
MFICYSSFSYRREYKSFSCMEISFHNHRCAGKRDDPWLWPGGAGTDGHLLYMGTIILMQSAIHFSWRTNPFFHSFVHSTPSSLACRLQHACLSLLSCILAFTSALLIFIPSDAPLLACFACSPVLLFPLLQQGQRGSDYFSIVNRGSPLSGRRSSL